MFNRSVLINMIGMWIIYHLYSTYSEQGFAVLCLVTQLCPTLCDTVDCSLPGSSVHGVLQARILEWVAMPSSRGSSQPRDRTQVSIMNKALGRY